MEHTGLIAAAIMIAQQQEIARLETELAAVTAILDKEKIPTECSRALFRHLGKRPMSIAERVQYVVNQNSYNEDVASEILATRDERKDDLEAENKLLWELFKACETNDFDKMESAYIAVK